ncbi:Stress responsive A B Barrel domain-containing protein [Rutstroemia sp. NJR-2017a WRK4]|nr:Stress responsive A B Barrel domain-containing protein [Rutstroemia sp. NJR-2017a WRK4]
MTTPITRVTMIKIAEENHATALKGFETFTKNQQRDGKPYILSMEAGPALGNVREQGFTFVAKSVFKNQEDMKFYEDECEAHNEFKKFLKENAPVTGLMTCIFMPGVTFAL